MLHTPYELSRHVACGGTFILVDGGTAGDVFSPCGKIIPFPERNGLFSGSPADSLSAIEELQRLESYADFLVVVQPAFWWLSYYSEWHDYIKTNYRTVLRSERLIVFDVRSTSEDSEAIAGQVGQL